MLKRLYIKDFAIVDQLEIEFESGFQVLTGETGAGKSILVGAIALICGERGQSDLVRSGGDKAILEAEFELSNENEKSNLLAELGVESLGQTLIIRREINSKGISRAFINDSPVNINALGLLTSDLIDLHGQHQHQKLIHPENHIHYLDAYGKIYPLLDKYRQIYQTFLDQQNLYASLTEKRKSGYEKHDLYSFQIKELENARLVDGELETLTAEKKILENNELLFEISQTVGSMLYSDESSASNNVSKALDKLRSLAEIDPSFEELLKNVESAMLTVEEAGRHCQSYATGLEFNQGRLEEIRNRETEIEWLLKKYQVTSVSELLVRQKEMKNELSDFENFDERIENLEKEIEQSREKLKKITLDLSESRKEIATNFEKELIPLLKSVGLNHARFQVDFHWQESDDGIITVEGIKYDLTSSGIDQVIFSIGLNIGEPVRPLHKVASGGEVSRIMLGLKTLLADTDQIDTLIFDEIDSGISGRFAEIVGKKMREIAQHHQLLVITHLPQISAQAHSHYAVLKEEEAGRTKVFVNKLDGEDRVLEISKLLGGEEMTPQAIANARELIQKGKIIDKVSK